VSIESLFSSKVPWVTRLGGVASEHITASRLGVEVIRIGGNAVDAAVATSLTLAVTQPHLGGLGSDLVALIYTASDGKVHFLNATGWAPAKMSRSLGKVPLRGPLSIVVPGMLAGLYSMWRRFGELEWSRLISMVIDGVGGGFPIGPSLVRAISNVLNDADDAFKSTYPINAKPWDLVKIPKLINALRLIGENGPDAFYRGDIGESIVNHVNSLGGVL
jgi:gamma-glutamyltranspeptidase/glutathione hydrolase